MKTYLWKIKKDKLAKTNLALYCKGNTQESLKLIKEVPPVDAFTKKITSEFYNFLR